jgi:hypothetical protein
MLREHLKFLDLFDKLCIICSIYTLDDSQLLLPRSSNMEASLAMT